MKPTLFAILAILIQLSNGFPSDHPSLKQKERNPESGDAFEGDMLLTPAQLARKQVFKSGYSDSRAHWPNNTVPYEFAENTGHTEDSKALIKSAMSLIADATSNCIKFVEHTSEANYINIKYNTEFCASGVGKIDGTGPQPLKLKPTCSMGSIAHEFIHALGFAHEHTRYDRDTYVRIIEENILEKNKVNFVMDDPEWYVDFGISYDYDSIMHYGATDFGKPNADGSEMETIHVLQEGVTIGQRDHLSEKDVQKIKKMYKCE